MIRPAVLAFALCALLTGNVRGTLSPEQLGELRVRLDKLADAIALGQSDQTRRTAAALQHWTLQHDASLPVDLVCDKALALAERDFDPSDPAAMQLRDSIRQLATNLDALQRAPPAGSDDLPAAREALAQVLSRAEYHNAVETNWWQQVLLWLAGWMNRLMRLLNRIPGVDKVASAMLYVAVALLLLPLLAIVGYLIWWRAKQRRAMPRVQTATSVTTLESPDVHLARAEAFVRHGQYVGALKQFHLAVLAALEQRGFVAPDRTRTNWEYLAQLEARPAPLESASLLRGLNRLYDRAVFGTQRCDETLAREFGETSQRLLQTLAGGPHP